MFHFALVFNCSFLVQLIANLSHFVLLCVNLLNRDANQRHIVCPFEGHPVKPQTFIKSTLIFRVDPCRNIMLDLRLG